MSSFKDAVTSSTASEHLIGRVKWFNNKAGYGFITVTDGERSGSDIFVHHSAVNVENQQYKYLVQGEYVEFDLIRVETDKHEWQASRVSGIRGGKLMCETRHELKLARNEYKSNRAPTQAEPKVPRQRGSHPEAKRGPERNSLSSRTRGEGQHVRGDSSRGSKREWTLVTNSGDSTRQTRPSNVKRNTNPN